MNVDFSRLLSDPAFTRLARAIAATGPCDLDRPALSVTMGCLHRFAVARGRDVRIGQLESAGRDVAAEWRLHREQVAGAHQAFFQAVEALQRQATALRPVITKELDTVIALAREPAHPLRQLLEECASSLGFSRSERDWFLEELRRVDYQPVRLLCAGGLTDLLTILHGSSVGELGLQRAGFVRMTGDPDMDVRLTRIAAHCRHHGVTASVFIVLLIVLVADAVAQACGSGARARGDGLGEGAGSSHQPQGE